MITGTQIIVFADFNGANIEYIIEQILAAGFSIPLEIQNIIDNVLQEQNEPIVIYDNTSNNSFKLYINKQVKSPRLKSRGFPFHSFTY